MARPLLAALGDGSAGQQVVMVPGNHDHELVAPALEAARLDGPDLASGRAPSIPARARCRGGWRSSCRPRGGAGLPGLRLRDDVWATHGHYLDLHLTVPRVESIFAHAVGRMSAPRRRGARSTATRRRSRRYTHSRTAWCRARRPSGSPGGNLPQHMEAPPRRAACRAWRWGGWPSPPPSASNRAARPLPLGHLGVELRRGGLRAMAAVVADRTSRRITWSSATPIAPGRCRRRRGLVAAGRRPADQQGKLAARGRLRAADGPSIPYRPGRVDMARGRGAAGVGNVLEAAASGGSDAAAPAGEANGQLGRAGIEPSLHIGRLMATRCCGSSSVPHRYVSRAAMWLTDRRPRRGRRQTD